MNRGILFSLVAALVVVISVSDLQAGIFRRQYHRTPVCVRRVKRVKQVFATRPPSATWGTFPARAWDLGNHFGEWPPYYHKSKR